MKDIFGKNNYRFGVETVVSIYLNNYQFVLGADLADYTKRQGFFNDENPCNIYFVMRRPKVSIDPDSIKVNGKTVKLNLLIHARERLGVVGLSCEFNNANSKIEYLTEYPFNMILFRDQEQPLMLARPSTLIDSSLVENNVETEDLDYEVLYVGQSYGKNGKRTAIDRLAAHETVQKIYTHALTQFPDSDIWIMLANFAQLSVLFAAGSALVNVNKDDKKIERRKVKHMVKNNGLPITEKQFINLTEAALIKYFEPEYNLNFKDNFPDTRHKSYSECYTLDIRAVNIEVGTREIIRRIYTNKTGRKPYHSQMFEFSSAQERISFLDFSKSNH